VYPNLKEITVCDDREKDIKSYRDIIDKLPEKIKFNIYLATDGKLTLLDNKLITVIDEEIEKFF
jgi:flavorubredoxin